MLQRLLRSGVCWRGCVCAVCVCVCGRAPLGYPLDELVIGHAEVGAVGEVGVEALAGAARHALTAPQVQQLQRRRALQVLQACVRQLMTAWDAQTDKQKER